MTPYGRIARDNGYLLCHAQGLDLTVKGIALELQIPFPCWVRMQIDRNDGGAWGGLVAQLKGRLHPELGVYYEIDATKRLDTTSAISGLITCTGIAQVAVDITTNSGTANARGDVFLYAVGYEL